MKSRLLVAAVGGAVALGFGLTPALAGAQEGATISVEQSHPASDSVHYIVQVTEGGQPVEGATVTATATGEDGTAGQPVPLTAGTDGQYQGTVELGEEGIWTVRFESTNPAASLDYTQEMPAESGAGDDDGGGGSAVVLILVVVFLAVVAGIAGWIWFTRQRERADDPVGPPNEPL